MFKFSTLLETVKFCHRMPTTMLPLPSFRDLPAAVANLTATPGLPAHVVATPAPPPLHLPTLVASPTAPPPVVYPSSCNTSLAEVSSFLFILDQQRVKGEKRGIVCTTIQFEPMLNIRKFLKYDGRSYRDCGGPAGPAPAGGGQSGLLPHHYLELGAWPDYGLPGAAAGQTHPAPLD
jgi:hypothetical protein